MKTLAPAERTALLRLARASIRDPLVHDAAFRDLLETIDIGPALQEERGAFVTLKQPSPGDEPRNYALRGCIGTIGPGTSLYRNVIRNAERAAFRDPRFSSLTLEELDDVRIEISALTPMVPVERVEDLVIGRDGVQLLAGSARAVFLPQVAPEFGWSREQWLEQLAVKAGMRKSGWKRARLESFRAEVFGEDSRQGTNVKKY